jgi:3-deoxy-D-manno-octulosonic-acid transferase
LQNTIWIHGVSVGEIKAVQSLITRLHELYPNIPLIISSTSKNGKATAEKLYPEHTIISFTLDFSWAILAFFKHFKPRLIILIELELWPNLLLLAKQKNIPVLVINGRLSEHSYKNYKKFLGRLFPFFTQGITKFSVQAEIYKQRFLQLNIDENRLLVTGNMKFDTVTTEKNFAKELISKINIEPKLEILVAGSTHAPEEEMIISHMIKIQKKFPNFRIILVPRDPNRADEICNLVTKRGLFPIKTSQLSKGFNFPFNHIVISDKMGELQSLYSICTIALIGGSLIPHGGQNFLEPAFFGKVVLCGHSMYNFPDLQIFLEQKAIVQSSSILGIVNSIEYFLENPKERQKIGKMAEMIVKKGKGSTLQNLALITSHINNPTFKVVKLPT